MPSLVIEQPGVPPITVELSAPETRLGRAEDNEVVLVAEEVSRHHAKVSVQGDKTILYDLKSLNGTYVNRQRIVERILSDKDEVWFGGKCRAVFRDDPEAVKQQRKKERESKLSRDLQKISEEMERVSANMTLIGKTVPGGMTVVSQRPTPVSQDEMAKLSRAFRRLDALYKASKLIAAEFDLQKRMENLLDLAIEVMNADRGFLILRRDGTEELGATVVRGMDKELGESSPSMGIARRAAIEGEPVLMADRSADAQFGMRDSVIMQRIHSALCVPLIIEDRILGAMYVDSRRIGFKFTEEDLELFQTFANQAAMAIENVRLYEQTVLAEKKRASLCRFLSPAVVDVIMNQDAELELGGQSRVVTTMFCDIRSFTPMAEKMPPDLLVTLLNQHFTAMTEIIFQYQGTLDKYVGDEVMALFGAPFSTGRDAEQAVRAALAMQAKNRELNEERIAAGHPRFDMGIGINTGEVIAGYVGSPDRMDFTVLGDHVNVAARFCSVAKPGQIVVGEATFEVVKDIVEANSIGTPVLKGKAEPVPAYEIVRLKH